MIVRTQLKRTLCGRWISVAVCPVWHTGRVSYRTTATARFTERDDQEDGEEAGSQPARLHGSDGGSEGGVVNGKGSLKRKTLADQRVEELMALLFPRDSKFVGAERTSAMEQLDWEELDDVSSFVDDIISFESSPKDYSIKPWKAREQEISAEPTTTIRLTTMVSTLQKSDIQRLLRDELSQEYSDRQVSQILRRLDFSFGHLYDDMYVRKNGYLLKFANAKMAGYFMRVMGDVHMYGMRIKLTPVFEDDEQAMKLNPGDSESRQVILSGLPYDVTSERLRHYLEPQFNLGPEQDSIQSAPSFDSEIRFIVALRDKSEAVRMVRRLHRKKWDWYHTVHVQRLE